MLQFPSDWTQRFGVNIASAFPPDRGARVRYYERLRPQPSFATIVARLIASDSDFRVRDVGEMVRIVTVEGEYGAWVAIDGHRGGRDARRYVGAVFMGEFATALDVIAILPAYFGELEQLSLQLLRSQRFEMTRRPRQYFYVPPTDWQGVPSGLIANWYPPDFPKNLSNIVVLPTSEGAREAVVEAAVSALSAGLAVEESVRSKTTSAGNVEGDYASVRGRRGERSIQRDLAVFIVPPYCYRMRFETANLERLLDLQEVFRGVAASFRPLPTPDEAQVGRAFSPRLDLFDHWTS